MKQLKLKDLTKENTRELIKEYNINECEVTLKDNSKILVWCWDSDLDTLFDDLVITVGQTVNKEKEFNFDDNYNPVGLNYNDYIETLELIQDGVTYYVSVYCAYNGVGAENALAIFNRIEKTMEDFQKLKERNELARQMLERDDLDFVSRREWEKELCNVFDALYRQAKLFQSYQNDNHYYKAQPVKNDDGFTPHEIDVNKAWQYTLTTILNKEFYGIIEADSMYDAKKKLLEEFGVNDSRFIRCITFVPMIISSNLIIINNPVKINISDSEINKILTELMLKEIDKGNQPVMYTIRTKQGITYHGYNSIPRGVGRPMSANWVNYLAENVINEKFDNLDKYNVFPITLMSSELDLLREKESLT